MEAEFGENKNIINWVSTKVETKQGAMEVLDKHVSGSFRDDMLQVICMAIRCTARAPVPRPTMNEIVQFLGEIEPCRFVSCKSTNNTKHTLNPTTINKTFQL